MGSGLGLARSLRERGRDAVAGDFLTCTLLKAYASRRPMLRWVASVVAAEAVRDYSDTAVMLYEVRLGTVSSPLLGTNVPSRVSGAPRHHYSYTAQTSY